MKQLCISLGLGLLSLSLSLGALAQDRLVMKNGDVLTGNITKLADGDVYLEPSYADEFAIAVAQIQSVETEETFEIELGDRSKVDARLAVNGLGLQVLIIDGAEKVTTLDSIWEATEPEKHYTRDSRIDFSLTSNGGNTDSANTLLYGDTQIKVGDHRHNLDLTFRREETDGDNTKEQDLLNYRYGWMFNDPWFIGGSLTFERDPIRELDHRYVVGANVGRDIFDDATKFMNFSIGVGFSDEEIAGATDSGAVGLWNFTYNHDFLAGKMEFHHTHNITQQSFAEKNTILKSTTGIRTEFIKDVYGDISLRYDYETEPALSATNDDTTLTIGIGAEF
jgi:putative salt-induced outer membrane protein YdiY